MRSVAKQGKRFVQDGNHSLHGLEGLLHAAHDHVPDIYSIVLYTVLEWCMREGKGERISFRSIFMSVNLFHRCWTVYC